MQKDDTLLRELVDIGGTGKPVITQEELKQLQAEAEQKNCGVVDLLVERKTLTSDDVARARAEECGAEFVELDRLEIEGQVINLIPRETAEHFQVIPIKQTGDVITVATIDPYDFDRLDKLRLWLKVQIEIVIASEEAIDAAIKKYYPLPFLPLGALREAAEKE